MIELTDFTPSAEAATPATVPGEPLIHLDLRELLFFGFLENKGMVLIGAAVSGVGYVLARRTGTRS